jgi:hypothetical protein
VTPKGTTKDRMNINKKVEVIIELTAEEIKAKKEIAEKIKLKQ